MSIQAVLEVADLDVVLGRGQRANRVLSGVSLKVRRGEIVALVGETGSGKTTLARTIVGLVDPVRGAVAVEGTVISKLRGRERRELRRRGQVQFVFQDPLRSLDPDFTVEQLVGEVLVIRGDANRETIRDRVVDSLGLVGLDPSFLDRRPGEISGGQRQRVAIARALIAEPQLLICDEPVSALDASTRNHVLRLLDGLRRELDLPIIVISHDLSSLAGVADRVVVLYRGRIVEDGPISRVFERQRHPYTGLLLASAPSVAHNKPLAVQQLRRNAADLPAMIGADGCVFSPRCPFAIEQCSVQPPLIADEEGWAVACHRQSEWWSLAERRPVTVGSGAYS